MEKPGKDSKKVGKSSEEPGKARKSLEKLERAWKSWKEPGMTNTPGMVRNSQKGQNDRMLQKWSKVRE
ncbi:MAG: hypothetical protein CMF59_16495 [Leptospiraceae bacterium]|nr:hypothetical protein [Leptospiraceae bacterium]